MKFLPSFRLNVTWKNLFFATQNIFIRKDKDLHDLFKDLCPKYIAEMPSSRWALFFLLKALNLKDGDEIIIPAYTYFAVPSAIIRAGCIPVFVDIEENAINIDPDLIEKALTEKTKAIIATHLCGFPCNMSKIKTIAEKHKLIVIEDCAQSLGSKYNGLTIGSIGVVSYFAFSATKNLTMLRGGIAATNDKQIAEFIQNVSGNFLPFSKIETLNDIIKAAILKIAVSKPIILFTCIFFYIFSLLEFDITKELFKEKTIFLNQKYPKRGRFNYAEKQLAENQLKIFKESCRIKERNGLLFYELIKNSAKAIPPKLIKNATNVFSGMPVFVKNKFTARKKLLSKGIDTSTGFVQCCPNINEFSKYSRTSYPNAERAEKELLYFIASDTITEKDIRYLANILINL